MFAKNQNNGDVVRCQTHRVLESAEHSLKKLVLKDGYNGSGEYSPKIASWRPTKVTNNSVVLHRPIRSCIPVNEKVTVAKSVDNIVNKNGHASSSSVSKSLSASELDHSKTERPPTLKYCKIDSLYESDDELTVRNELTLEKNGYYESDGSLRLSLTSLSSTATQEDQEAYDLARREAFNDWLLRKEQEKRDKNKKLNAKPQNDEKMTANQREELFNKWVERKRILKEEENSRLQLEKYKEEEERKRQLHGKEDKIREWSRRKDIKKKELQRQEKEEADRQNRLKERRKKEGEEAYQKWLRRSKNKPLPVPLNKGELSMRGSISSMYVNPEPWKTAEKPADNTSTTSS